MTVNFVLRPVLLLIFAVICADSARKADPPVNFEAVDTTDTSITLSWDAPPLGAGMKLKGYQLLYRDASSRKDKKLNLKKNDSPYTLSDLAEGTTYVFAIKTKTQDGTGPATDPLEVSTLAAGGGDALPGIPQYFEVLPTGDSLYARWLPPEDGDFTGYILGIGQNTPDEQEVRLDSSSQAHSFENLETGVEYVLSLRTYNDAGQSQVVQQRAFLERQTPPPPESFTATPGVTSIQTSWAQGEEDVRGYVVGIGIDDLEEETVELNWDVTSYLFDGLLPATLYLVSVRAVNENGQGEATTEKVTTDELSTPTPPEIEAVESTSDSITVRWRAVGSATSYEITLDPAGTEVVAGDVTSYTFTDLDADYDYVLRLKSINDIGTSPPSEQLVATEPLGAPGPPVITSLEATSSTVTMEWQSTDVAISRFDVELVGVDRQALGGGASSHTFTNLSPNTEYTAQVRALNPGGPGEWASQTIYTEPVNTPPAPVIESDSATPDSITINWQPVEDALSFEIALGSEDPVSLSPLDTSYTFTGLESDTEYTVALRVTNIGGISPPATERISTEAMRPLSRPTIRSAEATSNSIAIRWAIPEEPVNNFEVTLVGKDPILLPAQETTYTFSNLQPDTRYTVELRVINDGGASNPARSRVVTDSMPETVEPEGPPVHSGDYKVRDFQAEVQGQTVVLTWEPPTLQRDDTLLGYLLTITAEEISLDTALRLHYRQNAYTFRNLEPLVTFHAMLEPIRRELPTVPANVTFTTYVSRFVPPRIELVEILNSNSARVVWMDPTVSPVTGITDSRYYTLRYRPTQGSPNYLLANTRDFEYSVGDLIPDTEYEFSVQTILEGVTSGFSEVVRNTTLSETDGQAPRLLTVVQLTLEFPNFIHATLNWLPPLERTDEVSGYNVQYSNVVDPTELDFQNLPVEGPVLAATVPKLTTNITASFRVQAFFFSGNPLGPFSPVVSFVTPVSAQTSAEEGNCESELAIITERITATRERGGGVPPLGVPLPYCDEYLSQYACPWPTLVCTCIPRGTNVIATVPNAKPNPGCGPVSEDPPCRRAYNRMIEAIKEARRTGAMLLGASLPYCKEDGYYQTKQCGGSLCYCVDEMGIPNGLEAPVWEGEGLNCR